MHNVFTTKFCKKKTKKQKNKWYTFQWTIMFKPKNRPNRMVDLTKDLTSSFIFIFLQGYGFSNGFIMFLPKNSPKRDKNVLFNAWFYMFRPKNRPNRMLGGLDKRYHFFIRFHLSTSKWIYKGMHIFLPQNSKKKKKKICFSMGDFICLGKKKLRKYILKIPTSSFGWQE